MTEDDGRLFRAATPEKVEQDGEPVASRFSDIVNERMRELRSEKQRDFRLSTHFAKTTAVEQSDASTSFLDDYDDDPQSSMNSVAGASSSARRNITTAFQLDRDELLQPEGNDSSTTAASAAAAPVVTLIRAIARAGYCSRRAAIDVVNSGKVKVDGVVARDPFQRIAATNDIHVEGHSGRLRFAPPRLWAFHKPAFVNIRGPNPSEQRIMWRRYAQMLGLDHLIPVGSLPTRSHGLLMLTNDGELSRWLEHPSTRVQSTYVYRLRPPIDHALAMRLNTHGVSIGGVQHREFEFHPFTGGRSRHAIRIKVRPPEQLSATGADGAQQYRAPMPVVQMLEALQRRIVRGGRVSFGPFTLRGLGPGGMREVSVPPYYMKYVNPLWMPFIERDWPYFRRLRVQRLMRVARWRHLNDRETEEVEAYSCDELRQVFSASGADGSGPTAAHAIEEEAQRFAEALVETPDVSGVKFRSIDDDNDDGSDGVPISQQVPFQI